MEVANSYVVALNELSKKFGVTIDWTKQNIQPYIQDMMGRVVKYEIFDSVLGMLFCILILGASIFSIMLAVKDYKNKYKEYKDGKSYSQPEFMDYFLLTLLVIPIFCSTFTLFSCIGDLYKCITLPEMIFLETLLSYMS